MSMSAEKEKKAVDEIAGVEKRPRSKAFWQDSFVEEFAMMARKLRKGQTYVNGKLTAGDKYAAIIERKLQKIDAAIALLEANPQMAKDYGEQGKDVMDVLELIEAKAADMEAEEQIKGAAEVVRKNLPGARLNQLVRKGRAGGFADAYGNIDDNKLWA